MSKKKENKTLGHSNGWNSVKDRPLFTVDSLGRWVCTEDGDKEFMAAVPYRDKTKPGEELWWIRHCVVEDETGLCVVGDVDNEPAGWSLEDVAYWMPIPGPPLVKDESPTNAEAEQDSKPNAHALLPDVLLDVEGYPTEEWLQYIKSYEPDESLPLLAFVETALAKGWYMSNWGYKLHRKRNGKRKLELHTGGWSGNEEIIAAIKSNIWLTHFQMRYVSWRNGGHYYFELLAS